MSGAGRHFINSCNRLAAILQDAQRETWQVAILETGDAGDETLESLYQY